MAYVADVVFWVSAIVTAAAAVAAATLVRKRPKGHPPIRPLTNEERAQNMLVVADEHDKRSFEASISTRPTQRKYHSNRAEALRKEAAELLEPPSFCPDAATRKDYR